MLLGGSCPTFSSLGRHSTTGSCQPKNCKSPADRIPPKRPIGLLRTPQQRDRNEGRARVAKAKFPELKEISDFNFALVPSLNAPMVAALALALGAFIDRHEVILAVGPPGTGKTHIASGIGLGAWRQGRRARFVTVAELVMELSEAQAEHRLSRLETQLDRLDLLICDELGFIRLDSDQAQLLFILLAHRYTRGGLIITSNLEFGDWTGVFNDDARLVSALLDRLTHRCHVLQFQAESYRFRGSRNACERRLTGRREPRDQSSEALSPKTSP